METWGTCLVISRASTKTSCCVQGITVTECLEKVHKWSRTVLFFHPRHWLNHLLQRRRLLLYCDLLRNLTGFTREIIVSEKLLKLRINLGFENFGQVSKVWMLVFGYLLLNCWLSSFWQKQLYIQYLENRVCLEAVIKKIWATGSPASSQGLCFAPNPGNYFACVFFFFFFGALIYFSEFSEFSLI